MIQYFLCSIPVLFVSILPFFSHSYPYLCCCSALFFTVSLLVLLFLASVAAPHYFLFCFFYPMKFFLPIRLPKVNVTVLYWTVILLMISLPRVTRYLPLDQVALEAHQDPSPLSHPTESERENERRRGKGRRRHQHSENVDMTVFEQ